MFDSLTDLAGGPRVLPSRKLNGVVEGLYVASSEHFETRAVDVLPVDLRGIDGDLHSGLTRRSSSREPWYKRGTEIRNERQLSIVAADELAVVAERMDIPTLLPEWIGANLLIGGVPHLSMLPAGTLLFFRNGATVKIDAQNGPCRYAGKQVAIRAGMADIDGGALLFPKVAKRLRGVVAWIEKPGTISMGEDVTVRIPEQWIYSGR